MMVGTNREGNDAIVIQQVASVTLYIKDEDEALKFYTEVLGFEKRADFPVKPGVRWLTVGPKGQQNFEIVLHNPYGWHNESVAAAMADLIGKAAPLVLHTDDCRAEFERLKSHGVVFSQEPRDQMYGVEAVFADLYGNSYVLLEPKTFS